MRKVKIKVLKKEFYTSLAEEFLEDGTEAGDCPIMNVGDVFIYDGDARMPEGFCAWAWIDIYRAVSAISAGATFAPWYRKDDMQVLCCSDGIRPVIFLVEALEV